MSEKKPNHSLNENAVSWGSTVLFMFFVFFFFNFWQLIHEKYFVEEILNDTGAVIATNYNFGVILIVLGVLVAIVAVLTLIFRQKIWQFVTSMQLGICLMTGITLGTIIGTLVFQNSQPQDYISFYSEPMFDIFTRLHFIDVFDAWWFLAYEVILAIVLVCVTMNRKFWLPEKLGAPAIHLGIVTVIIGSFIGVAYHTDAMLVIGENDETEFAVSKDFLEEFRNIPEYVEKLKGRNDLTDEMDLIKSENISLIPEEYLIPLGGKFKLNDFEELYYDEPYILAQGQFSVKKDIRTGQEQQVTRSVQQIEFDSKKPVVLKSGFGTLKVVKVYRNYLLKENLVKSEKGKSFARINVTGRDSLTSNVLINEDSQSSPFKGTSSALMDMSSGLSSLSGSAFTLRYVYEEPGEESLKSMGLTEAKPLYVFTGQRMMQGSEEPAEIALKLGEAADLGTTGLKIKMISFVPNLGAKDESASDSYLNPAAEVEVSGEGLEKPLRVFLAASGDVTNSESIMELVRQTKILIRFIPLPENNLLLVGSTGELHVYAGGELKEKVNLKEADFTPPYTEISLKLIDVIEKAEIQKNHTDENPERSIAVEYEIEKDGKITAGFLELIDANVSREMTTSNPERYFHDLDSKNFISLNIRGDYIKDWRSHASVTQPDGSVIDHVIRVNEPLVYNGFFFYQSDWRPKVPYGETPEKWYTILRVTNDPGLILVYLGLGLITFGMIWVFYIGPRFKKKKTS